MRFATILSSCLAIAFVAAVPAIGAPDVAARPNILLAIADDASWVHFGAYGERVFKTPAFDRVAREGVLFNHAFCASPSCTPSRAGLLTGQHIWRLEESGNLWSTLQAKFKVYPELLEAQGYAVGLRGKGWGPGNPKPGGRNRNPAGPAFNSFDAFLKTVPADKPFCFWLGPSDPHRPYDTGSGVKSGKRPEDVQVPRFLPDTPEVRSDILDYGVEVERFDAAVGDVLRSLDAVGRTENTIVVVTSDNGMPFPRCKANLYDYGMRMPLAVRWPARVKAGRTVEDLVTLVDLAPTFVEAAGLVVPPEMTGRSLLPVLLSDKSGQVDPARNRVFYGRERHARVRADNLSYPSRALRTHEFLYIRNFKPDRWPAGDPPIYGDIDQAGNITGSPSKAAVVNHEDDPAVRRLFELACGKRPAEELYDLRNDPFQTRNVASETGYAGPRKSLREQLDRFLEETRDPRVTGGGEQFDLYPYYGADGRPVAPRN